MADTAKAAGPESAAKTWKAVSIGALGAAALMAAGAGFATLAADRARPKLPVEAQEPRPAAAFAPPGAGEAERVAAEQRRMLDEAERAVPAPRAAAGRRGWPVPDEVDYEHHAAAAVAAYHKVQRPSPSSTVPAFLEVPEPMAPAPIPVAAAPPAPGLPAQQPQANQNPPPRRAPASGRLRVVDGSEELALLEWRGAGQEPTRYYVRRGSEIAGHGRVNDIKRVGHAWVVVLHTGAALTQ